MFLKHRISFLLPFFKPRSFFFFSTQSNSEQYTEPSSFNPFDIFDIGETQTSRGSLIIIPTPIGNLKDLSIRQYEALLNADIIACEDTRITGHLFTLIKTRKLKDQMEDQFGVNLRDLKDEEQMDEGDILVKKKFEDKAKSFKEEEDVLKELILKTAPGTDIKDFELRKKLREELRIKAIKAKAKKILEGTDSLSFLSNVENSNAENEEDFYGLEDDFMGFLKKKIAETRAKRGRGILLSFYKYNEEARIAKLIKAMKYGFKVGLVSDAGTPTISDPGYKLVDTAIKEGIIVEALPGPTSITVALSLCGFPSDCYKFDGYLSKSQDLRLGKLSKAKLEGMTSVFYESSQRLDKTLISIEKVYGPNQLIFIAFEMTKMHQKTYRKTTKELIDLCNQNQIVFKGEITIVIPPYQRKFNSDVVLKKKIEEDINLDVIQKKEIEEEEQSKVFAQDRKNIHEIDEEHLMQVLDEMFDIKDKEMAEVVGEMLKLSKTRSLHIVRKFRTEKSPKTGFFDADMLKP